MTEDQQLAREVEGIDLILSGHTHTTLTQPIVEGDTYIVSAGPYCENLGSITFQWDESGEKTLVDYQLIPIDQTLPEDQEIASLVEEWKAQVGVDYLARYHLTYDQVLARADFSLTRPESGVQQGNPLGELVQSLPTACCGPICLRGISPSPRPLMCSPWEWGRMGPLVFHW